MKHVLFNFIDDYKVTQERILEELPAILPTDVSFYMMVPIGDYHHLFKYTLGDDGVIDCRLLSKNHVIEQCVLVNVADCLPGGIKAAISKVSQDEYYSLHAGRNNFKMSTTPVIKEILQNETPTIDVSG